MGALPSRQALITALISASLLAAIAWSMLMAVHDTGFSAWPHAISGGGRSEVSAPEPAAVGGTGSSTEAPGAGIIGRVALVARRPVTTPSAAAAARRINAGRPTSGNGATAGVSASSVRSLRPAPVAITSTAAASAATAAPAKAHKYGRESNPGQRHKSDNGTVHGTGKAHARQTGTGKAHGGNSSATSARYRGHSGGPEAGRAWRGQSLRHGRHVARHR